MRFITKFWHNILVFLRIRRHTEYITKKNILKNVQKYQQANLGYLQNLMIHIETGNTKFSSADKLKADFTDGVVRFK